MGRFDHELPTCGHGVARVEREIQHHLLDLSGVGADASRIARGADDEIDVLAEHVPKHLQRRLHDCVEVEHTRSKHLVPAHREQLPRQLRRLVACIANRVESFPSSRRKPRLTTQDLAVREDHREQVVEVMCDPACKAPDGFELLCLA